VVIENIKRGLQRITGLGRPSSEEAKDAVREVEPNQFMFTDTGAVPNNPTLPLLIYKKAVRLNHATDPAAVFETLFESNGWGRSWRNGIYDYVHYHSSVHEVLGIARGSARLRFGGEAGKALDVSAGDVAVLPAGTGHQCLEASGDFLVVGAYPAEGEYDECTGKLEERNFARDAIARTPVPKRDPVYGEAGLRRLWRKYKGAHGSA
jgi:uncharacterized protein YjlB